MATAGRRPVVSTVLALISGRPRRRPATCSRASAPPPLGDVVPTHTWVRLPDDGRCRLDTGRRPCVRSKTDVEHLPRDGAIHRWLELNLPRRFAVEAAWRPSPRRPRKRWCF